VTGGKFRDRSCVYWDMTVSTTHDPLDVETPTFDGVADRT
jgi:hypothetical protein